MEAATEKVCTGCHEARAPEDYHRDRTAGDGRATRCKSKYQAQYVAAHRTTTRKAD